MKVAYGTGAYLITPKKKMRIGFLFILERQTTKQMYT